MSAALADRRVASVAALTPLMAAVFVVFLITGVALPTLPLHVHQRLGFGAFAVGLVAGAQFAASLVSRVRRYSHTRASFCANNSLSRWA